jgi:hypothetical protein
MNNFLFCPLIFCWFEKCASYFFMFCLLSCYRTHMIRLTGFDEFTHVCWCFIFLGYFFVDFFSFHPSTFKLLGIGHCSFFLSFDWVFMASLFMSRVWHSNFGWRGSLWLFFFCFFSISSLILDCLRIERHSFFFFLQAFLCASCHDHFFFFLIWSTCYCCFFSYHKIKWKPSYWTQLNL